MKLQRVLFLFILFCVFLSTSSLTAQYGCFNEPGTEDIRCCDRLLFKFSAGNVWDLHNMMIPGSQGSGSGSLNHYSNGTGGTLIFRSKTLTSPTPGASAISFSNFGPVGGVPIPDLPYTVPNPSNENIGAIRVQLKHSGISGVFPSFTGCDPNRVNPETTPCVNSDGYLFFLSRNGANYPEEELTEVPDTRRYGPYYDGIAGSYNASPDSLGCTGNPCWRAPQPAPYAAIRSTEGLMLYGQSRWTQEAPNSIDSLCGADYSLCKGQTIYPRWAIVTHSPNGWFRSATKQWVISGLEVWGCVAPTGLFYTLSPCRLFDSRTGGYPVLGSRLVPTYGNCGIPTTARAIVGNVTVVGISTGHLVLRTTETQSAPTTSIINWKAGETKANNFTVNVGPSGILQIVTDKYGTTEVSGHVIIDVTGYYE